MEAEDVLATLRRNRTMDITTIGAKTGLPRRIEIWAWPDGDRLYLTGSPGRRDWYANLRANPDFTLHLKRGIQADVPARARAIEEPAARRLIFERLRPAHVDAWTAGAPLVEVDLSS
jgi:deazaflavin-dependent oxidoreductase (nitroreductase family)